MKKSDKVKVQKNKEKVETYVTISSDSPWTRELQRRGMKTVASTPTDSLTISQNDGKGSADVNRNTIPLFVCPPADRSAAELLMRYTYSASAPEAASDVSAPAISPRYLVYVGEGRGGRNANNVFFDVLNEHWHLIRCFPLPVVADFEDYDSMFVFERIRR